jgi:ribonuclease P protein component
VFSGGRKSADRLFTILYRPNDLDLPRLGFAIAKQRVRLAVKRNRLRRLVRESFRLGRAQLPAVDIVVMARSDAATATNQNVIASLNLHWQRLASKSTT